MKDEEELLWLRGKAILKHVCPGRFCKLDKGWRHFVHDTGTLPIKGYPGCVNDHNFWHMKSSAIDASCPRAGYEHELKQGLSCIFASRIQTRIILAEHLTSFFRSENAVVWLTVWHHQFWKNPRLSFTRHAKSIFSQKETFSMNDFQPKGRNHRGGSTHSMLHVSLDAKMRMMLFSREKKWPEELGDLLLFLKDGWCAWCVVGPLSIALDSALGRVLAQASIFCVINPDMITFKPFSASTFRRHKALPTPADAYAANHTCYLALAASMAADRSSLLHDPYIDLHRMFWLETWHLILSPPESLTVSHKLLRRRGMYSCFSLLC